MTQITKTLHEIADTAYRLYQRREPSAENRAALSALFDAAKKRGVIARTTDPRRENLPALQTAARALERALDAQYLTRIH